MPPKAKTITSDLILIKSSSESDDNRPTASSTIHQDALPDRQHVASTAQLLEVSTATQSVDEFEASELLETANANVQTVDPRETEEKHGDNLRTQEMSEVITEIACLQKFLDVLPDISTEYALNTINKRTTDTTRTVARCEILIADTLELGMYPKEKDEINEKKRKRGAEVNVTNDEKFERSDNPDYLYDAWRLLMEVFPNEDSNRLLALLDKKKSFFEAYVSQAKHSYPCLGRAPGLTDDPNPHNERRVEFDLVKRGSQIPKELYAAMEKIEDMKAAPEAKKEEEKTERGDLREGQNNRSIGECCCCFDELPLNRMVRCDAQTAHLYCRECPRKQVGILISEGKCRPGCFAATDCGGRFTRKQLKELLDAKIFERMERMQQREDITAAGIDFLSDCPFCDFKMECLPVNIDKEFRCQNLKCGKTSCRLCNKMSHLPRTCVEAKEADPLAKRHFVEEAMSAAMIRKCNRCNNPFIKVYGCNRMTCGVCGNTQCYVCREDVGHYNHFGDTTKGMCPLIENSEERHEEEVKEAERKAKATIRAGNPEISDVDLTVQVSDSVKKEQKARKAMIDKAHNVAPMAPLFIDEDDRYFDALMARWRALGLEFGAQLDGRENNPGMGLGADPQILRPQPPRNAFHEFILHEPRRDPPRRWNQPTGFFRARQEPQRDLPRNRNRARDPHERRQEPRRDPRGNLWEVPPPAEQVIQMPQTMNARAELNRRAERNDPRPIPAAILFGMAGVALPLHRQPLLPNVVPVPQAAPLPGDAHRMRRRNETMQRSRRR